MPCKHTRDDIPVGKPMLAMARNSYGVSSGTSLKLGLTPARARSCPSCGLGRSGVGISVWGPSQPTCLQTRLYRHMTRAAIIKWTNHLDVRCVDETTLGPFGPLVLRRPGVCRLLGWLPGSMIRGHPVPRPPRSLRVRGVAWLPGSYPWSPRSITSARN